MTDNTLDSSQPGAGITAEGLTIVENGSTAQVTQLEEIDSDDRPVADLARELPTEQADAVEQMGDWAGDAGNHHGDDAQKLQEIERK